MLRSIFLKTMRDQRVPALAWGFGLGLIVLINAVGWAHSYPDAQSRQMLAAQVQGGGLSSIAVLFGEPRNIDQLPGWIEWRGLGLNHIIVGVLVVLTAAGITRGSEEAGTLECVLAASSSRIRVFLEQSLAVLVSLAVTCLVIWLFVIVSPLAAGEPGINLARSLEAVLNLFVGAAFAASLTLIVSQLTTSRRTAALIGGGLVVAMHIWDNIGAIAPALADFRPISPFYLNSRSTPMADGHLSVLGLGGLALLAVLGAGLACWLLRRRDFNGAVRLPGRRSYQAPAAIDVRAGDFRQELGLRGPFWHGLEEVRVPILAWGIGLALFSGAMTAVAPNLREAYTQASGPFRTILGGQITDSRLISFLVFGFMPLFASFYAVTLAATWVEEELDGRLELELACPTPRVTYFLQRLAASVLAIMLVIALAGAGMYVGAAAARVDLSWGDALLALVLLLPFSAAIVSFGYCASSLRPQLVVGVGAAALLASYLLDILAALFGWPNAVRSLSVFYLYGNPLTDGIDWASTGALVALAVLFASAGSLAFNNRDISR
jgi:ABC-2 type transport system permease protein